MHKAFEYSVLYISQYAITIIQIVLHIFNKSYLN